jgi:curved DNA-binding protein CbpA
MNFQEALGVLEISPQVTYEEASKAYKDLIRIWHPDNFGMKPDLLAKANSKTKQINEAWEVYQRDRGQGFSNNSSSSGSTYSQGPDKKPQKNEWLWRIVGGLIVIIPIYFFMGKFDSPDQKVEKQLVQMSNTSSFKREVQRTLYR